MKNKIEKLIKRYEKRMNKHQLKVSDYELRKDNLSVHGHWSLGYFDGKATVYEDVLDDLKDLMNETDVVGETNIAPETTVSQNSLKTMTMSIVNENGHSITEEDAMEIMRLIDEALSTKLELANGGKYAMMHSEPKAAKNMDSKIEINITHR